MNPVHWASTISNYMITQGCAKGIQDISTDRWVPLSPRRTFLYPSFHIPITELWLPKLRQPKEGS